MPRGGSKPGERRGGRKKGTPNKLTAQLQTPLAQAARRYDGNALQTLVAIMNDDTATAAARLRCAELILDRAHGKPVYLEDPNRDPDFVPLAERLKWYAREDAIEAAAGISRFTVRLTRQELEAVAARGYPGALAGRKGAETAVQAFVSNVLLPAIGVTVEAVPLSVLAEMDPFGP
jgi:hypothetical protein